MTTEERGRGGSAEIKFAVVEGKLEAQLPSEGKVFSVAALSTAGLANEENDKKLLYARVASVEQWNDLCNLKPGHSIRLEGPSGVGKSILTWAWAVWEWKSRKKNVFWMHLKRQSHVEVVHMIHNSNGPCMFKNETTVGYQEALEILKSQRAINADIAILDGVKGSVEKHYELIQFLHNIKENEKRISVEVSSLSGKRDVQGERIYGVKRRKINGWRLDDFRKASEMPKFRETIESIIGGDPRQNIEERVLQKYHYAGYSARWMFEYTIEDIMDEVALLMQYVPDILTLYDRTAAERVTDAVNHLYLTVHISKYKLVRTFTSNYVFKQFTLKLGTKVVQLAYNIADEMENPSFEGWVVEMDFLNQVKMAKDGDKTKGENVVTIMDKKGEKESWIVQHTEEFLDDENLKKLSELKRLKEELKEGKDPKEHNHVWLIPKKWNQGAYDAIYIYIMEGKLVVTFVQVTKSETHSLKIYMMKKTVEALANIFEIGGVRVVVVQPTENKERDFKFGSRVGTLYNNRVGTTSSVWKLGDGQKDQCEVRYFNKTGKA